MSLTITSAGLSEGVALLGSKSLASAISAIKTAFAGHLQNPGDDAIAVEDVLAVAAQVPGLEDAEYGEEAIKLIVLAAALMKAQPGGGLWGAIVASVEGVQATVANADGSQL